MQVGLKKPMECKLSQDGYVLSFIQFQVIIKTQKNSYTKSSQKRHEHKHLTIFTKA